MTKFKNFIKRNGVALGTAVATASALAMAGVSYAACTSPSVTLTDVVCNAVDSVQTAYTAALVANLGVIVTAVIAISVTFILIKLAMRWIKRSVH